MANIPKKHIAGLVFIIIALVFHIIGFAAPYWYYQKIGTSKQYSGLWRTCTDTVLTGEVCLSYVDASSIPAWLEAVQAMETIALLLLMAALVVFIIKMFFLSGKMVLKYVVIGLLVAAAVCIIIGVIVYGAEVGSPQTEHLHFAFAFVIVAAGVSLISIVFLCI